MADLMKGLKWIGIVAVLGLVGGGLVALGMNFTQGSFQGDDGDSKTPVNKTPKTGDMVSVLDAGTDADVTLPVKATNAEVLLVKDSVGIEDKTQAPTHFGDYVDFSLSDAKSGLTQGVDYRQVSLSSSDTATFTDLEPGTYDIILVDQASTRDYHYFFGEVTMPEKISKWKAENNNVVELTRNENNVKVVNFDRFPSYDTDSISVFATNGEIKQADSSAGSVDLKNPSSNTTDRVRTVERTFTYSSGVDYLDKVVVDNFNAGDGISKVEATVKVDGTEKFNKILFDGSTDEFGSDNSFSEKLDVNPQENPIKADSQVKVVLDITYDYTTLASSAGDSDISDGESMLDFKITDIYGNTAGADGKTSVTG